MSILNLRKTAFLVAALAMPGFVDVWLDPSVAEAAKPATARLLSVSSPALRLPEPSMPTGNAVAQQSNPSRTSRMDPDRLGSELAGRREANTEVFAGSDGRQTVVLHTEPVNYRPSPDAAWQKIDNTLIPDPKRDGWIRNRDNAWKVQFGPITADGGGVELATGAGVIRMKPDYDSPNGIVLPVIDEDHPNTLTYADVWPGVDVVYSVTSVQVKESIVVRSADRSEFPFIVQGLGLVDQTPNTALTAAGMPLSPKVTAASAGAWRLGALEVSDGSGRVTDRSGVTAKVAGMGPAKDGRQRLTVAVDKGWLAGQIGGRRPVVIDPSFQLPSNGSNNWACSYLLFESLREDTLCDGIRTGTHHDPDTDWDPIHGRYWWRSIARFNYRPYIEGKDVIAAHIWGNEYDELGLGFAPEPVQVWDAIAANAAGAVANGDWGRYLVDEQWVPPDPWCYWGLEVCWNVTDRIHNWQFVGDFTGNWDDGMFGFSGDENDWDYLERLSYKRFLPGDIKLVLNVNTRPGKPAVVSPADGALAIDTLEPTLTWGTVDDADGHEVRYTAKIATSPDGESGMVAQSAELIEPAGATQMSWTVPKGVLKDGVTYYWKVLAHDIALDNGGGAYVPSEVRKLTVDRKMGMGGLSPSDELGPVTTNLVTGNPSIKVDGPSMPTVGGGVGVSFVYNGRDTRNGLKGTYRNDVDRDHVIEASDPIHLVRTDPVMRFEWGDGGSPSPGVPTDYFNVNWSGSVRMPAGKNWQFGVRSDDGIRLRYNGIQVLDLWGGLQPNPVWESGSHPGGAPRSISLDYYEHSGPAYLQLLVREDLGGGSHGPASDIPADWLLPESPGLPSGWSLQAADANVAFTRATVNEGSVTLTAADGETFSFARTASGGYTPPPDSDDIVVVNADGTVAVHDDEGMDYVFRPDGGLFTIRTPLDDRRPAAARNTFDSLARLVAIDDPVSGRKVTLRYAATDGDTNCPNSPPLGGTGFEAEEGMLCRVTYWDGTSTDLFYFKDTDLLSHVVNPGDAWWSFSYDAEARLVSLADPDARDLLFTGNRTDSDLNRLFTQIAYDPATTGIKSRVRTVTLPAAQQADAARTSRTYTYQQNSTGGILIDGSATVTRGGLPEMFRGVKYDFRGRKTEDTNAVGMTSKTFWDARDLVYATLTADGLLTATLQDQKRNPVEVWGPAPVSLFNKIWYGNDFYLPKDPDCMSATAPMSACDVGRTHTGYDEGIKGLQVKWWNNTGREGPVIAHAYDADSVRDTDSGRPEGVSADNAGALYTGDLTFPTAGVFKLQLCVGQADAAWLFIDGRQVTQQWLPDASAPHRCTDPEDQAAWIKSGAAGEQHSIHLKYADFAYPDLLHLNWVRPDGTYEPAGGLTPVFNMVTSKIEPDDKKTTMAYTDPASGIGPQHNLVVKAVIDPGGLNLTTTTTYEAAGGSTGFLRQISKTLPGGDATKTAISYYAADNPSTPANEAETRDNPCTTAVDPANQGGMTKLSTGADPDGGGLQVPLVREFVYDTAGRIVASRIAGDPWTCVTHDSRGRPTEVRYPAFGGQPARTVTTVYAVDPDGTGPKGPSVALNTVADANGTVTSETDMLDRPVSYRDVFGNLTSYTYDVAGREATQNGPAGLIEKFYDRADRITQLKRAGVVQAIDILYHPQSGKLESVLYPGNGTKATFGYDTLGRHKKVTWAKTGGATITSDEVTRNQIGDVVEQLVDGVDHHAGDDFFYDKAGRLYDAYVPGRRLQYEFGALTTSACGASTLTAAGANTNRTKQTVTPTGGTPAVTTYCYDRADRLTSTSDTAVGVLAYDAHGNTTTIFGETHTYDAADRHMSTSKGSTTVSYVRDATDRIVERRHNGLTVARYGSTGSGDTADFVTNTANQVQQVTLGLPGGAILTAQASGNVWSYPNLHGDIAATAGADGIKQGATTVYDPFGNQIGGALPDNSAGNLDYAWLGQHQRPLEHETGLQPVIEMGARQYSPLLGRFIEVDPVDGGSANDYEYVNGDPVNNFDLAGRCNSVAPWCIIGILKGSERLPSGFARWLRNRYRGKSNVLISITIDGKRRRALRVGSCSAGTNFLSTFRNACKVHDLGYDLLRFFNSKKHQYGWKGRASRAAVDALFGYDTRHACDSRIPKPGCRTVARIMYGAVTANSIWQRYGPP